MRFSLAISLLVLCIASVLFVGCSDSATPTQNGNDYANNGFSYPIAEPPNEVTLLHWDFSDSETHKYSFDLSSENTSHTQYDEPQIRWETVTQTAVVDCDLLVQSQGDGTARLAMDDIEMTWSMSSEDEKIGPTTETQPTQEIGEIKEDGTKKQGETQFLASRYFFSLPAESLEIGEPLIIDTQIPYNAFGESLPVLGTITITLLNYMTVDDETCAHLKSVIDISDIQLTDDLFQSYDCSVKGTTESLFSIDYNRFVAVEGQIQMMQAILEEPYSEIVLGGCDDPSDENILLCTMSNESFQIQLVE